MGDGLIGSVNLRVTYVVYQDGVNYRLESGTRADPQRRYAGLVSSAAVAATAEALRQQQRTIAGVQTYIERAGPQRHGFQFSYGHKLEFEVKNALVVLVARGDAVVNKRGRGFEFMPTRRLMQAAAD